MILYFCLIYIAAFFGHRKARLLVQGQRETQRRLREGSNIYKDCIWFHAASVGEFEQARPIIERLKAEQPQQKILLTFFSPSGYEMRKHYDKADFVLYLPFATRRNAKRFVEAVCPRKVIFVKYEFWPAYLRLFKQKRIPAYSISAIFRPTQLFFRPWGKAYLDLLRCFRHIYVQDSESLRLLQSHGITHCSVAGDTRFDRVNYLATHAAAPDGALLPFEVPKKLLVAGSTWPQDEALLARYVDTHPDVSLLVVPHEITDSHLHEIFQLFHGRYLCLSEMECHRHLTPAPRVVVVDKMGLLSRLYRYGQVAYVGGGFGAGIHNTIEAAVYGMPVVFGPKYQHFREAKALIAAGAGFSVRNYQELERAMDNSFAHAEALGLNARQYVESELGATDKIYQDLFKTRKS